MYIFVHVHSSSRFCRALTLYLCCNFISCCNTLVYARTLGATHCKYNMEDSRPSRNPDHAIPTAVNDLIAQLWPYIRASVKASVESSIMSAAQGGSIPFLQGVSVQDLDLFGNEPPALQHARVEGTAHDTALCAILR